MRIYRADRLLIAIPQSPTVCISPGEFVFISAWLVYFRLLYACATVYQKCFIGSAWMNREAASMMGQAVREH